MGQAGKGGNGYTSLISGSSLVYAGGGGGGYERTAGSAGLAGAGGTGGGGAGAYSASNTTSVNGIAGTVNTGGGGGGGRTFSPDCANVTAEHKRNTPKNWACNCFIINVFSRDAANIIFHK